MVVWWVVTQRMLTEAARAGDLERLTVWARQGVRITSGVPLFVAAEEGFLVVMRLLVQQLGATVSHATRDGRTPLIFAAADGDLPVVHCMVELGADVHQAMPNGNTPFILAAEEGHLAIVRYLIKLGAQIKVVNNYGYIALLASTRYGHFGTMQYLLEEAGANMDDVNNDNQTC
jgi:ankyrin repeat protein